MDNPITSKETQQFNGMIKHFRLPTEQELEAAEAQRQKLADESFNPYE